MGTLPVLRYFSFPLGLSLWTEQPATCCKPASRGLPPLWVHPCHPTRPELSPGPTRGRLLPRSPRLPRSDKVPQGLQIQRVLGSRHLLRQRLPVSPSPEVPSVPWAPGASTSRRTTRRCGKCVRRARCHSRTCACHTTQDTACHTHSVPRMLCAFTLHTAHLQCCPRHTHRTQAHQRHSQHTRAPA